jgi:hypothetical protein
MEGRRNHWNRALALTLAAIVLGVPAAADEEAPSPIDKADRTAVVYTTPDSAVVEAELRADAGAAQAASKSSWRSCHLESDTAPVTDANVKIYLAHSNERLFVLYCDGQWSGLVWVPISPGPRRAPTPADIRDEAMRLREEIPMRQVAIGVNPAGSGLVGVDAWFWVEGYRGEVIAHPTSAFGIPVEVEARPSSYRWSFGDGSVVESDSLGKAYPQRSEIRHTYERSSSGFASGYPVEIEFRFEVRYRLSVGPWIDLPPITRAARLDYAVRESQAVITR